MSSCSPHLAGKRFLMWLLFLVCSSLISLGALIAISVANLPPVCEDGRATQMVLWIQVGAGVHLALLHCINIALVMANRECMVRLAGFLLVMDVLTTVAWCVWGPGPICTSPTKIPFLYLAYVYMIERGCEMLIMFGFGFGFQPMVHRTRYQTI
jgi:hypothetical protein